MDKATFNRFRSIVYDKCGISLKDGKEAMVSARIGKRMRALNIRDHRAYLKYLTMDRSGEEVIHFLDVISTNVTSFYREPEHFDFLKKAVRKWMKQGQRRFRFWSAACSSGEEPYSIAMTLLEAVQDGWADMKILATDISTRVLSKSRKGIYDGDSLKTVPPDLRRRYFHRLRDGDHTIYRVTGEMKRLIVFKRLNLSRPPFPMRGPLDAIFCRNVMIYFDNDLCRSLLAELYRLLKPGGYLMTGHAEGLTCLLSDFKPVIPSIYIKG